MKYLIDTHMLLWASTLDKKLPKPALDIMQSGDVGVSYSVIASWELAIKEEKGRLRLPNNFFADLPHLGFDCLDISSKHIEKLRELPKLHGDPFDRMLIAQALSEDMVLISSDKRFSEYPVRLLSC